MAQVKELYKSFIRKPLDTYDHPKFEFMVREWYSEDTGESDGSGGEDTDNDDKEYCIYMFGVNDHNESVCLKVKRFTPYFYVKIPDGFMDYDIRRVLGKIRGFLGNKSNELVSHSIMRRKDAYGFNNLREFRFIRLVFGTLGAYRTAKNWFKYQNKDRRISSYETSIDPMLVFTHLRDIQSSGWVNVDKDKLTNENKNMVSRCQHNYSCFWKHVCPNNERADIPGFVTMSFDLECYSHDYSFPEPSHPDNYITQIGSSFQRYGDEENILKTVIVVGECDPVDGVHLVVCKTERELIKKWVDLLNRTDPDQLIGFNIDSFDWSYLWDRAIHNDVLDYVCERLPRLFHLESTFSKSTLESNAYGFNSFNFITTIGVGQIDLLHWFRKNTKLDMYSLDFIANKYLGEKKRDVSPKKIFEWSGPNGNPRDRAIVADYCAQDTVLPIKLMEDRCMFPNLVEMSRVTCVPFNWLITRGEQIKAYSQINKEMRKLKFLLPSSYPDTVSDYEGATVLNCKRGIYYEPVSGLDFASLYPSIMIAWNLCPTTWVSKSEYNGLSDVQYEHFETDIGTHTFVQSTKGIVPDILERLWKERKKIKKQMKEEKDPRMNSILNGKQLAIKVSMNSIYGFFGVGGGKGLLPCSAIASSVTAIGRNMIKHSKDCAETWYDGSEEAGGIKAVVVYGDSVRGDTPLVIQRRCGEFGPWGKHVIRIDQFPQFVGSGCGWKPFPRFKVGDVTLQDKEHFVPPQGDNYIDTESGPKRIKRVVRHKCRKKMYRVTTEKGTIVVTQDHSLLDVGGNMVKPGELEVGQELLWKNSFI